jgi:hypothetical protein
MTTASLWLGPAAEGNDCTGIVSQVEEQLPAIPSKAFGFFLKRKTGKRREEISETLRGCVANGIPAGIANILDGKCLDIP